MATDSRAVRNEDARREEVARSASMKPSNMNEDGSVRDEPARKALKQQLETASTSPNERMAPDHSVGTPAWMEAHSDDHLHSDGGSTLAPEAESVLTVFEEVKQELKDEKQERDQKQESRKSENDASPVVAKDNTRK